MNERTRTRAHRLVVAALATSLVLACSTVIGCGKYGKPVRQKSEPQGVAAATEGDHPPEWKEVT